MPAPFIVLQHLLPKLTLTRLLGRLAAYEGGALTHGFIRRYIAHYRVDMSEAADPIADHYRSFNAFFTRALRPQARPRAAAAWLCPVDGAISQLGSLDDGRLLQAKNRTYSAAALLADPGYAAAFDRGAFATIYLSPRDYHRIHMPCAGRLLRMTHVPGTLYSVNPATTRGIDQLFARNERVICAFDTAHGPLAVVLVGATIVGSIATSWHGVVNATRPAQIRHWDYGEASHRLEAGAELGQFLLGSTVVLLFAPGAIRFNAHWHAERPVRVFEAMGDA